MQLRSQLVPHQLLCLSFPIMHVPTISQHPGPLLWGRRWAVRVRGMWWFVLLPAPEVTIHVRPFQGCLHSRAGTKIPLAPLRAAARQGEDRHTDTPPCAPPDTS